MDSLRSLYQKSIDVMRGLFTLLSEIYATVQDSLPAIKIACIVGIASFIYGFDQTFMNSSMEAEPHHGDLILTSTVGSIIGGVLSLVLNFLYGRKTALLVTDIIFTLGYFILIVSPYAWTQFLSRSLVGIGIGVSITTSPIMVAEVSPSSARGFIVGLLGSMIGLGQAVSNLSNGYLTLKKFHPRIRCLPAAIFAIIQFGMLKFSTSTSIFTSTSTSTSTVIHQSAVWNMLLESMKKDTVQKALWAGITTNMIKETIGLKAAIYHGPSMMKTAGFDKTKLSSNLTGISLSGTFVSGLLVDKLGRKNILLVSLITIFFSSIYLFFQFSTPDQETRVLPFIALDVLIFSYCLGFGAIPITLNSEVHPSEFRVAGCVIAHITGCAIAFISGIIIKDWSNPILFLLNSFFAILGIVSTTFFVPETRTVELSKMNEILKKRIW